MKKILFITQKRNDAIWIVDYNIKQELQKRNHQFDFLELREKGETKWSIFKHYVQNTIKIILSAWKYKEIYFSRENPYIILLKSIFPKKIAIMTIHHVEDYRGNNIIGKLIIKYTNHFFAISEFTKKQLISIWAKSDDITVIYNWISNKYYPEIINQFTTYPYILYVGSEAPRKNLATLLKVFKQIHKKHPTIKLVKIGKAGNSKDEETTDHLIEKLWIWKDIIIMREFISEEELRKRYSNALCYISISKLEWFWLTIPEALACGCPVIASNIWPFNEIIGDSQISVDPEDHKNIEEAIEMYINNIQLRSKMWKDGISIAKRFKRDNNVDSLLKYFF